MSVVLLIIIRLFMFKTIVLSFIFSPIRINLDTMYDNLPRSLTQQQLLVKTKVEADPEVLEKRREIVATKKPAELAHIGGFDELPVPTALENIFKGGPPTAPRRKSRDVEGKRK